MNVIETAMKALREAEKERDSKWTRSRAADLLRAAADSLEPDAERPCCVYDHRCRRCTPKAPYG